MPTATFTPGNTVGPTNNPAVYSSAPTLGGFGTDHTPSGWPTSGRIIAAEVEVTNTAHEFTSNSQVALAVAAPAGLYPVPAGANMWAGAWSGGAGVHGGYRSSMVGAYYPAKIGGWLTDYISFSSSGGTGTWITSGTTATPAAGIDIRFRCRRTTWTTGNIVCGNGPSFGAWHTRVNLNGYGLWFGTEKVGTPGTFGWQSVPWASFTAPTSGAWHGFRVTVDTGTGDVDFWEDPSGDPTLTTWTHVASSSYMVSHGWLPAPMPSSLRIGSGATVSGGFDGDISHFEARDGGGALIHAAALDGMDGSGDSGWVHPAGSVSRTPASNTAHGATTPATVRMRWDADPVSTFGFDEWKLIVDAQTGSLTVDEIVLTWAGDRHRRGFGLIR